MTVARLTVRELHCASQARGQCLSALRVIEQRDTQSHECDIVILGARLDPAEGQADSIFFLIDEQFAVAVGVHFPELFLDCNGYRVARAEGG